MAKKLEWFFRERDPGEAKRGGNDNFAFQMSIDTLVRETIQNATDQRVGDKVVVEFVFEDHSGTSVNDLLELIGWESGLRQSLASIARGDSHLARRAAKALRSAEGDVVTSLTIRDIGARGLEGDEDGDSGNFVMLCRHVLVTDASRKALRGGAFGIGKSVLWAFSGASVALFSSLPLERGAGGKADRVGPARFFGRAYLVSHKVGNREYNSDGHLGGREMTNGKEWAVSVRGAEAQSAVRGTPLERDWVSTGTSVLIPFLSNPSVDEKLTAEVVVSRIVQAVQKWFWPSIEDGVLEVRVGTRHRGKEDLTAVALPGWVEYFRAALSATSSQKIEEEGGAAVSEVAVAVPQREVDPKHGKVEGSVSLHVVRLAEDQIEDVPDDIRNSVALVRGARMVVQYFNRSISPLVAPFVAIAKVGAYRGSTAEDLAAEAFFRDSEPPAHDRWEPTAGKLNENYRTGGQVAVRRFHEALGEEVKRLLGGSTGGAGRTPRKLAELLRGGKGVDKKRRTERFSMGRKIIDRSEPSLISASVRIDRNQGRGSWSATLAVVLVDEQGTSRELPLTAISEGDLMAAGATCEKVYGRDNSSVRFVKVNVPASLDSIDINLTASTADSAIADRSLADVKANYSQDSRRSK